MEWIKSFSLAPRATVIGVAIVGLLAVSLRVTAGLSKSDDAAVTPTLSVKSSEPATQPTYTSNTANLETATFALG